MSLSTYAVLIGTWLVLSLSPRPTLATLQARSTTPGSQLEGPVVLRIDGHEIRRRTFENWLLRTYGERRARAFAELIILRELHGTRSLDTYRAAVLEEFKIRIDGAFGGDRSKFVAELARFGRSYEGRLAERTLDLEYEELTGKLTSVRDFRVALEVEVQPPLLPEGIETPLTDDIDLVHVRWTEADRKESSRKALEHSIRRSEYAAWMRRLQGEKVVSRFVEAFMVSKAARERKVSVSEAELRARTELDIATTIREEHLGDRDAWLKDLARSGRTETEYRNEYILRMRVDLLLDKLIRTERAVAPAEIESAWVEEYGPGGILHELRWLRIDSELPAITDERTPEETQRLLREALLEAQEKASALRQRIEDGEDFATLAEKHSDDPVTRSNGGRPAPSFRIRHLAEVFQTAVRALKPGEVSKPMSHAGRVYVFEKLAVQITPLAKVADQLRDRLMARRPNEVQISRKKNELSRDAEVDILPELFR